MSVYKRNFILFCQWFITRLRMWHVFRRPLCIRRAGSAPVGSPVVTDSSELRRLVKLL